MFKSVILMGGPQKGYTISYMTQLNDNFETG
jgi:hypothetical protein